MSKKRRRDEEGLTIEELRQLRAYRRSPISQWQLDACEAAIAGLPTSPRKLPSDFIIVVSPKTESADDSEITQPEFTFVE